MRPVSAAFQEAVRQPVRQDRIEGFIGLWDSETVFRSWTFNETQIVQGSLSITDQLGNGKFGFGGAYTRNLSIKLDLTKFESMDRTLINLTDGEIMLFYYLTLEDGTEERVYLGQFFIDSEKSSRKFNVLSITAADGLSKFDTPANSHSDETLYGAYCYACHGTNGNKTTITNTPQFFESLPNGTMSLTYDNSQIQTNRDLLMWLGELTGTIVRECRDDPPDWERSPLFDSPEGRPELVQIPIKYTKANTSGNFDLEAFKADNGSIIPADVRFSTEFSDTSIRVTTWNTNYKGKTLTAHASWTIEPDTLEGTMELNSNPLLDSKSENDVRIALNKILDYGEELRFCPFKITFNGNPAIECGDFVYLEPGGSIDETQYRHYGIVTYYKWRFHGKSEIRCSTDAAASYTRPKETEERTQSVLRIGVKKASARTATPSESTKAKSQLEKRVDALEGKTGASDRLVAPDGSMWVLDNEMLKHYAADGTRDCSVYINHKYGSAAFDVKINFYTPDWGDWKKVEFSSDGAEYINAIIGSEDRGITLATKSSSAITPFRPLIKFNLANNNYKQLELWERYIYYQNNENGAISRYRINMTSV